MSDIGSTRSLITYSFRLKDKHCQILNAMAYSVNYVWNYCNETQKKAARSGRKWLTGFDLCYLTAGSGKYLGLHSHTVQQVCKNFDKSLRRCNKPWLRWRGKKSLGWVPFSTDHVKFDGENFKFNGVLYKPMHIHDGIKIGMKICAGSFSEDSLGHWYINVPVEIEINEQQSNNSAIAIDLGLKDLATLSNGEKIEMPSFYRKSEQKLAKAQRANKKNLARRIHTKIKNQRKDFLHKASTAMAKEHGLIVVGNVSSSKLAKTNMAKSVNDAGWYSFKRMLSYKSIMNGGRMIEVNEAYSSQTCSECGCLPTSRPRGIAGLGVREWACSECGAVHDRDVNAAKNILRVGLDTLVEGAAT